MKRILAFCFFPSFTPPTNGGESRLFNLYRALSRHHHVTLLTSGFHGCEPQIITHGANFVERRLPKGDDFLRVWQDWQSCAGEGDMSAPCLAVAASKLSALHLAYLEEYPAADVILHEYPFTVAYDLFAGLDRKLRIYDAPNCEAELYQSLHPSNKSKPIHDVVASTEQQLLRVANVLLYCSEADALKFKELAPESEYLEFFVPNGMLPLAAIAGGGGCEINRAVFMGSAHAPNVQAARFIIDELAPSFPHIQFEFIGDCVPLSVSGRNIIAHGKVSPHRKQQLLLQADVALNPMDAGSGSNLKVFDYFSHGLPVLSTPMGMRGIDAITGVHCELANLDGYVEALQSMVDNPLHREKIAQAGYALACERYTWDKIVEPIASYLKTFIPEVVSDDQPVLVLNDYNPFKAVGGGATRTRGLYKAVAELSPVIVICFSADGLLTVEQPISNVFVFSVPRTAEHEKELFRLNALSPISVDDVVASQHALNNGVLQKVYAVLREQARCIVVEHPYMAELPMLYGDRFVYSSQNNESLLKKKLFSPFAELSTLLAHVEQLERRVIERAAAVVAVSEEDARSLSVGVRTSGPIVVVRNGGGPPCMPRLEDVAEARKNIRARSVVFLGSAHPPNTEAANFIIKQLALQCPDIHYNIVGSVCGAFGARVPKNVHLWGVVDESLKCAVLQGCALAINPMSSGSGSNVKLADFIGNGLHTVTTEFGLRGYPEEVWPHVTVATLDGFSRALGAAMERVCGEPLDARLTRKAVFDKALSIQSLGKEYALFLAALEHRRKRILFVTYRYTSPALGGAELMMENLLRSLDATSEFDVDVVAAELSAMENQWRFSERYSFSKDTEAFTGLKHTRFARFPVDAGPERSKVTLRQAWLAQCVFEQSVYLQVLSEMVGPGLAWGWGGGEPRSPGFQRWAFVSCGIHVSGAGCIRIVGEAVQEISLLVQDSEGRLLFNESVKGQFAIELEVDAIYIELLSSVEQLPDDEQRPLAFMLHSLFCDGMPIDLLVSPFSALTSYPPESCFDVLQKAALVSREPLDIRLTELRGPWSSGLEGFLKKNISSYDLVVTHNSVFRPSVVAVELANQQGVPSILIPHAHLDDDYYHFPDVMACARQSTLVLAAPKAACDFYRRQGCNVSYLPGGIDALEVFNDGDVAEFKKLYTTPEPFVLVLGRKAGAKGYAKVIDAVTEVNKQCKLNVVLIGPDDDGVVINHANAFYFGLQPRSVVRGALQSCVALVNMSISESFGIVLLEAWMAARPVVVNKACAAFQDMAIDGENALIVDDSSLPAALLELTSNQDLCAYLAGNGRKQVAEYDWGLVGRSFVAECNRLMPSG